MRSKTHRGLVAMALLAAPIVALAAPVDLTCKWTHPTRPHLSQSLTMMVTARRLPSPSLAVLRIVSPSQQLRSGSMLVTATGWDYKYVLNRTTLVLTETNHAGSHAPIDYGCILVSPKV
jgi:hypothetical protein